MSKKTLWLSVTFCLFWTSCSSGNGNNLQDMLDNLSQADSFFSFLFTSQEPSGLGLSVAIHDLEVDDPCGFMANKGDSTAGLVTFSLMRIDLNHAVSGTFAIVFEEPQQGLYADGDNLALVGLTHVDDWQANSLIRASSGTLTISECPESVSDWNSGKQLTGELDAFFPVHSSRALECTVVQGPDVHLESCTCVDENGNQSQCENHTSGEDCCLTASEETVEFKLSFQAVQCKEFCAVAISDGPHPAGYSCGDLQ
jgi:hypothetical protein